MLYFSIALALQTAVCAGYERPSADIYYIPDEKPQDLVRRDGYDDNQAEAAVIKPILDSFSNTDAYDSRLKKLIDSVDYTHNYTFDPLSKGFSDRSTDFFNNVFLRGLDELGADAQYFGDDRKSGSLRSYKSILKKYLQWYDAYKSIANGISANDEEKTDNDVMYRQAKWDDQTKSSPRAPPVVNSKGITDIVKILTTKRRPTIVTSFRRKSSALLVDEELKDAALTKNKFSSTPKPSVRFEVTPKAHPKRGKCAHLKQKNYIATGRLLQEAEKLKKSSNKQRINVTKRSTLRPHSILPHTTKGVAKIIAAKKGSATVRNHINTGKLTTASSKGQTTTSASSVRDNRTSTTKQKNAKPPTVQVTTSSPSNSTGQLHHVGINNHKKSKTKKQQL